MTEILGIDYAYGAPIPGAAIVAAGKKFAWRYAVSDHSPPGRGITASEYQDLTAHGIEVGLYWEGHESWMLGGWTAGVSAAQNAQANIVAAGMPESMPCFFAHDIDPEPQHFSDIDDCLAGAASIMGLERIGVYGGWLLMDHCHTKGNAKFFAQTVAWEYGRGVHPSTNIYQYDTDHNWIAGVDVDLVRALTPIYGQASAFVSGPPIEPHYANPAPITWDKGDVGAQDLNGTPALAFLLEVKCISSKGAVPVQNSQDDAKPTGIPIKPNEKRVAIGSYRGGPHRNGFIVLDDKSRVIRSKFRPLVPLP